MVTATKYQFAEAFDGGQKRREETTLADARAAWEEEAKAIEQAAFERGSAEALAGLEAQTLAQVQAMNAQLVALGEHRAVLVETVSNASVELAQLAAAKISDILIERGPGRLVAETVLNALPLVIGEARIVVRLAEPLIDHIKSRMDEMALEAGFTGTVVLLGDDRIEPGDCRIEWANGGIERRAQDIKDEIAKTIERCLAEHHGEQNRTHSDDEADMPPQAEPTNEASDDA
ncbi:MAG: FliH/SctL family protein [Pseudomonadota bacterium]